jgi:hypothetical protein
MKRCLALGLLTALFAPQSGATEDNAWLTPQNGLKMQKAMKDAQSTGLIDVALNIDINPRPDDAGGNLFLVGFENVDEHGMPLEETAPGDFKQLGIWIQSWPFKQDVELIEGLHYRALYGYSEYPSPQDSVSKTHAVSSIKNGQLELMIQSSTANGRGVKGTPPEQVETQTLVPKDLQEEPVTITIEMEDPPSEWGGTVFLTGFSEFDSILRMPLRDSKPDHFLILRSDVQEMPVVVESQIKVDFAYFAMYSTGAGAHPEPGDKMSRAVVFEGGDSLEITIVDQEVGKAPPDAPAEAISMNQNLPVQHQKGMPLASEEPAPKDSPPRQTQLLFGVALLGGLGGWWLNQRSQKPQGTRSRLERVGESDKSS